MKNGSKKQYNPSCYKFIKDHQYLSLSLHSLGLTGVVADRSWNHKFIVASEICLYLVYNNT